MSTSFPAASLRTHEHARIQRRDLYLLCTALQAQTPLIRFVVDLLHNKTSTTDPQQIEVAEFGL